MPKLSQNFGATNINLSSGNSNTGLTPVRVIDIILDENHPEYVKYGNSNSIGAIKFTYIDRKISTGEPRTPDPRLRTKIPGLSSIKSQQLNKEQLNLKINTYFFMSINRVNIV